MAKKIVIAILIILNIIFFLIALQWLFNGGIEEYNSIIQEKGFLKFLEWFFTSIWEGLKTTLGF